MCTASQCAQLSVFGRYFVSQKLTVMSDVYSFGVVLLELVCGQLPIIISPANLDQKVALTEWVSRSAQKIVKSVDTLCWSVILILCLLYSTISPHIWCCR